MSTYGTSLAENPREKTRRRSSGYLQYRSFGYQINGKQNSAEITKNQTLDDIRIVKQKILNLIMGVRSLRKGGGDLSREV